MWIFIDELWFPSPQNVTIIHFPLNESICFLLPLARDQPTPKNLVRNLQEVSIFFIFEITILYSPYVYLRKTFQNSKFQRSLSLNPFPSNFHHPSPSLSLFLFSWVRQMITNDCGFIIPFSLFPKVSVIPRESCQIPVLYLQQGPLWLTTSRTKIYFFMATHSKRALYNSKTSTHKNQQTTEMSILSQKSSGLPINTLPLPCAAKI